jgi:urea carboxylase
MGITSVAVYSDADKHSLHVQQADESVHLGAAPAAQSYLDADKIIAAAKSTGAQAIHPGYGFLSENPAFADACAGASLVFIGPTGDQMRMFGLKHAARAMAKQHEVPLLPGSELLRDVAHAEQEAKRIGYPVMLKSTAGGGGIGMSLIRKPSELSAAFAAVGRLAKNNFKEGGIFLEKFVEHARYRGPDFWRQPRARRRHRRTRLLRSTPQSKGHRGNAGARPHGGTTRTTPRVSSTPR